jgi:CheY-like chemotaxis protein
MSPLAGDDALAAGARSGGKPKSLSRRSRHRIPWGGQFGAGIRQGKDERPSMTTVLVVDDSAVDRKLVGALLSQGSSVEVGYASDGAAALRSIHADCPDIVVTDLHMPGMNGLELVEAIHTQHPQVPVVLITGVGSEELAVQALKQGAASYVPKTVLARDLLPTVMHVLSVGRADENYERMQSCWVHNHSSFELTNDYQLIAPLVSMLRQTMQAMQLFDETQRTQMGMALEEAISNAIYHGNLELTTEELETIEYDLFDSEAPNLVDQRKNTPPYRDRRIQVESMISRSEVRFLVRDEGPGFDHSQLPNPDQSVTSEQRAGRGVTHMQLFFDEVIYNPKGNEVTLVKRRG